MEKFEIIENSINSYIETETVRNARALYPHEVKLSQLIREQYAKEREQLKRSVIEKISLYPVSYSTLADLVSKHYTFDFLEILLRLAKQNKLSMVINYFEIRLINDKSDKQSKLSVELFNTLTLRLAKAINNKHYLSRLSQNQFLVVSILKKEGLGEIHKLSEKINVIVSKSFKLKDTKYKLELKMSEVAYPIHGNQMSILLDILEMKIQYKLRL